MAPLSQNKSGSPSAICTNCTPLFTFGGGKDGFEGLKYKKVQTLHCKLFGKNLALLPLSENLYVSIVEQQRNVVGYCVLQWLYPDTMEILHMGIASDVQRQGLGRMLLANTMASLMKLGMAKIQLEVAENNIPRKQP